jgi:hypothetical protein
MFSRLFDAATLSDTRILSTEFSNTTSLPTSAEPSNFVVLFFLPFCINLYF